ncbi:MAG: 5-dehydro-4-deoxy-D-glucuronate isomerase [Desulfobacteraceae bacterium]|nr:5-dehydro-4-deoxy-D-glucuronate isomerase [Desulfobacteraceae bacterium]
MDFRHPANPNDFEAYTTDRMREEFLVQQLFVPGSIKLTYSFIDRMIIGGVCPESPLELEGGKALGTDFFLSRRELGVINVGPTGAVSVGGDTYALEKTDGLYIGQGAKTVVFASDDPSEPARFYLLSGPAHQSYPTQKVKMVEAESTRIGSPEQCNVRVLNKYIHPDGVPSANLVMGLTVVEPGNVWNSMPPCHLHARRMEVYFYFDVKPGAVVFHLMGEPERTRHIVVRNEEAIISPSWSLHAGAATSDYAFIWGMVGDNQTFGDMDIVDIDRLK